MKTKHWFMAIATLAIAGCSQNEIMEKKADADKSIGFNVYTGVQTKGTETTNDKLGAANAGNGFAVVALIPKNGGSDYDVYMTPRHVTKNDGGSWTYSDIAHWPVGGESLNFYSYAPYSDTFDGTNNAGGGIKTKPSTTELFNSTTPSIEFTIKSDWDKMVDLVAAKNETVSPTDNAISVAFSHVLTRIGFKAKTSADIGSGTTVKVTKLEILGSTSLSGSCFYEKGTYNIKDGSWSSPTALSGDYTITMANSGVEVSSTAANLLGTDNYLFCIPVSSLQADKIKVKITYTITSNSVTSEKTQIASIPQSHFAKGTAYSYLFTITLKEIKFTLDTMGSWTDASSADTGLTPTDIPTT